MPKNETSVILSVDNEVVDWFKELAPNILTVSTPPPRFTPTHIAVNLSLTKRCHRLCGSGVHYLRFVIFPVLFKLFS